MDTITVTSPANGKTIGQVEAHSYDDTVNAFDKARAAQKKWAKVSPAERKKIFLKYHDLVLDRQGALMDIIQDESGKCRRDAFEEIMDAAVTARHYAYRAGTLLKEHRAKPLMPVVQSVSVQHAPVGVVGVIAPWNYPLVLAISDAVVALLAGNAVVLKPDSQTPFTALMVADILASAGLPDGLLQVVTGRGAVVGKAIVENADYVMFTGSTATGRMLATQAAQRLTGFSGELGGKNPMIIAKDAPIDRLAEGTARACFSNAGQLCISIERIYVDDAIADLFIDRFVSYVKGMRVGDTHDWTVDMGTLISPEHLERVDGFVQDATSKGARVLTGGERLGGCMYAPTVLIDVPSSANLYRDEVFGPVVYIERVSSEEEAVAKANGTDYGLNCSIWASEATGRRIAAQIEAGTVNINEGYGTAWSTLDAPMGGWKQSGVGRRHADHGLLKYTEARTVAVQRFVPLMGPGSWDRETVASGATVALKVLKRVLR